MIDYQYLKDNISQDFVLNLKKMGSLLVIQGPQSEDILASINSNIKTMNVWTL